MLKTKPVGRHAAVLKYDVLTALGSYALSLDKAKQRLTLRLFTLITARYNWARDELAIGQREIARLWHVDERTVKREMAKLRALGWLEVKRPGARGRVTEYGLGLDQILADTSGIWGAVGPDFQARLAGPSVDNVVPLGSNATGEPPDVSDGTEWSLVKAILYQQDPGTFAAWFKELRRVSRAGGRLTLAAPTRFHANYVQTHLLEKLVSACRCVDDDLYHITILSGATVPDQTAVSSTV